MLMRILRKRSQSIQEQIILLFAASPTLRQVLNLIKKTVYITLQRHTHQTWNSRIELASKCPDNAFIPRVSNAGKSSNGLLTMHNGIQLIQGSYYGEPMGRLLEYNRGVHEPQEEKAFAQVLEQIEPGATMLELGAYWGFYSVWFGKQISNSKCLLLEPRKSNLFYGRENFRINELHGEFIHGYVGSHTSCPQHEPRTWTVDEICALHEIDRLTILHADIQGAELAMLHGANRMLASQLVDWLFISTHSNKLHEACQNTLSLYGYTILVEANLDQSYSMDGLIVAHRSNMPTVPALQISKR